MNYELVVFRIIIGNKKLVHFKIECLCIDVLMFIIFKQYLGFIVTTKPISTQITISPKNLIFSTANIMLNTPNYELFYRTNFDYKPLITLIYSVNSL
jgi:hypothetical protein